MNMITLSLFVLTLFASGTPPRGEEAQKLASAMGASLDMGPAQRATDAWKQSRQEYEQSKGQLYAGVVEANEEVTKLKEKSELLEAAKDKKNVEDSKLEQTAVNYLAMQMIKERKATSEMAKERDEALEYVPNMKKHHAQQMQALKDAAVQEANTLNDKIKEEQKRRKEDIDQKLKELDDLQKKGEQLLSEEKGRTAAAVQEGQNNVAAARAEADQERAQLMDTNQKLIDQNKADIEQKEGQITELEAKVEKTRQDGDNALSAAKAAAEQSQKAAVDKVEQEKTEMDADYKTQLGGVKNQLEQTQGEVSDLQSQLVEANAANQAAITKKQEETDAEIAKMTADNRAKVQEIEKAAEADKQAELAQQKQIADNQLAQSEANFKTRLDNAAASYEARQERAEARSKKYQENFEQESNRVNELTAENREFKQKYDELLENFKQAQQASQTAQSLAATNFNVPNLASSASSTAGTSAQTASANAVTADEVQVATNEVATAPINLKFVSVLVAVNLFLGCVAFAYYSESKKLQSFHASFLEEF